MYGHLIGERDHSQVAAAKLGHNCPESESVILLGLDFGQDPVLEKHNLRSLRYLLLNGILTLNELSPALRTCRSHAAGWNHGAALFLRNQPGGPKLFNSGRHPAWAAVATGTTRVRWDTAFRILCWLEVADFDLAFLFLCLWFVLHVTFHLFVICCLLWE